MSKSRTQKEELLKKYKDLIESKSGYLLVNSDKIDTSTVTKLKIELKNADANITVIKNSIFKVALQDTKQPLQVQEFDGPTALITFDDDPTAPAKLVKKMQKDTELLESRSGVYEGEFLVEALKELFGTVEDKRFNIMPGSHVPFASKNVKMQGPGSLYSAIAIGIPKDRKNNACLLMEDIGMLKAEADYVVTEIIENLTKSVISVGLNQKVEYKKCLVIFHKKFVPLGFTGCSLVAAPYFTLAKNAFPKDLMGRYDLEKLKKMTLQEWKKYMKYK